MRPAEERPPPSSRAGREDRQPRRGADSGFLGSTRTRGRTSVCRTLSVDQSQLCSLGICQGHWRPPPSSQVLGDQRATVEIRFKVGKTDKKSPKFRAVLPAETRGFVLLKYLHMHEITEQSSAEPVGRRPGNLALISRRKRFLGNSIAPSSGL